MKKKLTVAIDLGGTNTKMGLVDSHYNIVTEKILPTDGALGPLRAIENWTAVIEEWKKSFDLDLVGIGSPGPLDSEKGMILVTPNLSSWAEFKITEQIKNRTGIPCFIENDANCGALGEFAQSQCPDLVLITLGTGVGTGVISQGCLIRGTKGLGVEAGHMVIDSTGPVCGCGRRGCLEAFVGGRLFVERYNERATQKIPDLDAREVFLRAKRGDPLAEELVHSWTKHLAIGVGNLINIFNPREVILSGGLSAVFPELKVEFNQILLHEAFEPSLKCSKVIVSKLQEKAALMGAAHWAREQYHLKK